MPTEFTNDEFKQIFDHNKIKHAKAERMKSRRDGRSLQMFQTELSDPAEAEAIISNNITCPQIGIISEVEAFRAPISVRQCYNCQNFGQSAKNCKAKIKCVNCGEGHSHKGCPSRENTQPKCADCKGPHVANYKGCPAYKKQVFRQYVRIQTAWKLATLRMLMKPDKLPSLTTSYRPMSLMRLIMKLFEWVIEQSLPSYLEDIAFINKYQSGFRQNKSTDDHLFRLSQSVMESFNRGEHVLADFLDVEKALDNVWHNGLRYKIFMLVLPTKMTRWLSGFLVGRVYPSQLEWFPFRQNQPHCRGTTGFCPESITFPDICQ